MKPRPRTKVQIQVVSYNNAHSIAVCLRSVKRQRFKNYTLIVIDNASTDNTVAIVTSMGIKIIHNTTNLGYAAAHNIGLRCGESEYVLTLNPDVVLNDDFLEKLMRFMGKAPHFIGSAQPLLYRVEQMGQRSYVIDSAGLYMTRYRRQKLYCSGQDVRKIVLAKRYIFGPDGAAALYRRAMLTDIDMGHGVFDEDFFIHKEDVDVCWRAQLRGWKSLFIPDAVGYHIRTFRSGHRTQINSHIRMLAVRNRYYMMIKNDIISHVFRDIIPIAIYDMGILLYILLFERSSLGAYTDVVRMYKRMAEKRACIQSRRKALYNDIAQWFV